jgi:hypothetical protein
MNNLRKRFAFIGIGFALISCITAYASETSRKREKVRQQPYEIKVKAWGPTQAQVDAAKARVEKSPSLQAALKGAKYRLMSLQYIETETNNPTRYRVIFYDYTNDRTLVAESDFAATEPVSIRKEIQTESEAAHTPNVSGEEIFDAFEIVKKDKKLAEAARSGKLQTYEAMPPVTILNGERLINIGIITENSDEIVGVSFKNNRIVHYEDGAPPTAKVEHDEFCGVDPALHFKVPNGTAGQYELSYQHNGVRLWDMLIIRPSSSSGNPEERSGIEVREVKYKGKTVLKRGHVPVLNVSYTNDACGPFRDWQYDEGAFDAPEEGAQDPAPGLRILATGKVAKTVLESGDDQGNFQGVAVYTQDVGFGNELVMVTEMNAGWYRYIMEWRFAPDGTIRPRFGFGGVKDKCVCYAHHHHAFWRLDFDVVNPANKIFQIERGRKFLKPITNETKIARNYATNRGFVIQNANGNEAYSITPNIGDGNADVFAGGDFWLLRFKGSVFAPEEIDDPNTTVAANFAPWLDNESLVNQDVVVWYAGHFMHTEDGAHLLNPDRKGEVLTGSHVVGPDLRPIRW